MIILQENKINPASYSPLALAFIGDTVFDLLVREELILEANRPVKELHKAAASKVCASAQAESVRKIMDSLTEDELEIFKRGRNAHPGSTPKISPARIIITPRGWSLFSDDSTLRGKLTG